MKKLEAARALVSAFLVLATITGIGVMIWQIGRLDETRQAICALREDLQARTKQSEAFLANTPRDEPIRFGRYTFTRTQIQGNIANQRRTIQVLMRVDC